MTENIETNQGYRDAHEQWRCPSCWKMKHEIVRRTKAGKLKAFIVIHHDHFEDYARSKLLPIVNAMATSDAEKREALVTMGRACTALRAFDPVRICEMCNHAEAKAKQVVGAPSQFSFGAASMNCIMGNGALSEERAHKLWERLSIRLDMREFKLLGMVNKKSWAEPWREIEPEMDLTHSWEQLLDAAPLWGEAPTTARRIGVGGRP